jgi:putative two-component system response regulator
MTRLLLVDDEPIVRELIEEILREAGYDVVSADSAERAAELIDDPSLRLVVSDLVMPGLNGLELLGLVRDRRPSMPVVLVTGAGTQAHLTQALAEGAAGLILKPFTHAELLDAVSTTVRRAEHAERELRERLLTPTLAGALANAIETRDPTMHGHCERLSALAVLLSVELGLSPAEVETIRLGALIHDIGKIGIPDRILLKQESLDEEERALMRTHPTVGDRLLEPIDLLDGARTVVRHHHERWDGTGYPEGLRGGEIPLAARVVALSDAVEAMSGRRLYRRPLELDQILAELEQGRGAQWDPALVDVVLDLIESGDVDFGPHGLTVSERERVQGAADARPSVLLVESDAERAARTKRALEHELRAVVSHASDGVSARDLCRSSAWSLVVLDNDLPDGSSPELLGALREAAPEIPVVVITAQGGDAEALEAVRLGAVDYVNASGSYLEELTRRVRVLLEAA